MSGTADSTVTTRASSTATIDPTTDVMTLVNVFKAHEGQQQRLVDVLCEAGRSVMPTMPGFVSASVHRGDDGTSVVNYVQWRSIEDFQAMLAHESSRPHLVEAASIAGYDPIVCRPVETALPQGEVQR